MFQYFRSFTASSLACASLALMPPAVTARAAAPVPLGTNHVEVSYQTTGGPVSFSGDRDYSGTSPLDAAYLGGNIGVFNSSSSFAWRDRVSDFHPEVILPNEVVISHAFFKTSSSGQPANNADFFPNLVQDGNITFHVTNLHFDQPVYVDESTFLVHALWDIDQTDLLPQPYHHHHNCHSETDPFRNSDDFFSPVAAFATHPEPNYTFGTVTPEITGQGTDTLSVSLTLPYAMLQHLSDMDQGAPPSVPAPQGFLEPFHVHFEYAVAAAAQPAVAAAVTRKGNPSGPSGTCDLPLLPPRKSEPRDTRINQLRIRFNAPPGTPSGSGVTLEQATCAAPAFVPYSGASVVSSSVVGSELVLLFSPALENARTYRIDLGPEVTSLGGQSVEVRGLIGDVNGNGFVNSMDRSSIVGVWTGTRFSCNTDLNASGATNSQDRSLVVGQWTGAQNCAP